MTRVRQYHIIPENPVFAMRVHRIIRGGDTAHSHPWPNVSIVLRGAYLETTAKGTFERRPGSIIFRRSGDWHRIQILKEPCWTLFVTGPEGNVWREYPAEDKSTV